MPVPDFVLALRERVGHDLLWMPGVTAVVRDDEGRVLLGRRADTGQWALPSGILEPGEQPAVGLAREVEEETGVVVEVLRLDAVSTLAEVTYPNGDRAQYLDLCFACRPVGGEAHVADDESLEVGWFPLDALPPDLAERSAVRLHRSLEHRSTTWFAPAGPGATGSPNHLAELGNPAHPVVLRRAFAADVPAVVALLADDPLGAQREAGVDDAAYADAFARIDADPGELLVVADAGGDVVGTLQLSFLPSLSRGGALRAQVEAVRVSSSRRGGGLGRAMLQWAVEESRRRGCAVVQLTTDKSRVDAHRFYAGLGFTASHEGFKMLLAPEHDDPRST
jgi:ADP-ribose pyrophosphatase YjhB (NUDIX family)/GNAT superfamily N-acetyltransferase